VLTARNTTGTGQTYRYDSTQGGSLH
jgi:hypothetical protein